MVRQISLLAAAAGLAASSMASDAAAPTLARVATPVTNVNHQDGDESGPVVVAVLLVLLVLALIGVAAASADGDPQSP